MTRCLNIMAELVHSTDDGIESIALLIPKAGSKFSFISINLTKAEVQTDKGMVFLLDVLNTDQEVTDACEVLIKKYDKDTYNE